MLAALGLLMGWACRPAYAHDTVYYYYTNTLHSAVVETDAHGTVLERTYYAPYGQVLNRALRDGPGYTGKAEDPATGLVYMEARYYDPQAGRFLSTDPVLPTSDGGSFNRYAYAGDNPYRYTDPTGEAKAGADATPCRPGPYCGGGAADQGLLTVTGNVEDVDNRSGLGGDIGGSVEVGSGSGGAPKTGSAQAPDAITRSGHTYQSPGDAATAAGNGNYKKGVATQSEFQTGIVSVPGGYDYINPVFAPSDVNIVDASQFASEIAAQYKLVAWDHGHWDDVLGFSQRDMLQVYHNPNLPLYLTNRNGKTYLLNINILRHAVLNSSAKNIETFIEFNSQIQGQPVQ